MARRRNKYGAKKTRVGSLVFDSRREARRWGELLLLERAGRVRGLERQVPYRLVVNGLLVCTYRADFRYFERGELVVEDCKGVRTREYLLKRKLMLALYGVAIRET